MIVQKYGDEKQSRVILPMYEELFTLILFLSNKKIYHPEDDFWLVLQIP